MIRPEVEQELAHALLIELLAHQFCFPVRWIETQDLVLAKCKARKVIEIGPGDSLINMAKRTLDFKYRTHDAAHSISRQLLCYNRDAKEIYYDAGPAHEAIEPVPAHVPTPSPAASPVVTVTPTPLPAVSAAAFPDVPITASEIVKAIIATTLKRSTRDILLSNTIKGLAGGRSTLQNEIVGDLDKEFGGLPDSPEDTPLEELCSSVQANFSGQLGKKSASLVDKMLSSKMPGGFNITFVRKYLESRWNLASGRQDGVLLSAITTQPSARIGADSEAKIFWDSIVQTYISDAGLTLSGPAENAKTELTSEARVDPQALEFLRKDQKALYWEKLQLYARHLDIDLHASDNTIIGLKENMANLQEEIDLWNDEHGATYAMGIRPMFEPLKARVYDSFWNWALQDLLVMVYGVVNGSIKITDPHLVDQRIRLMNRSTPRLVAVLEYLSRFVPQSNSKNDAAVKQLLRSLIEDSERALKMDPVALRTQPVTAPQTTIDRHGVVKYIEVPRPEIPQFKRFAPEKGRRQSVNALASCKCNIGDPKNVSTSFDNSQLGNDPLLHIRRKGRGRWLYSETLTEPYLDALDSATSCGISFHDKNVLLTGAGHGSIGTEVLKGLLSGGSNVVVTTSSYSPEVAQRYQEIYSHYGARDSKLVLLPFNQGSQQDVEALVAYIYDNVSGLGWDLDHIVPFAALSENGRTIDSIDSQSELAHRLMLTNTLRLLGAVKRQKAAKGITTRPTQIILPMSPNHGILGNDGLYSESKLGLEALFSKWYSEDWSDYLSICGAVIGWTRGTSLMASNDLIAEGIEKLGVVTFSQLDMAYNVLGLMSPAVLALSQVEPLLADLSGGMDSVPNLKERITQIRENISRTSEIHRAISQEAILENRSTTSADEKAHMAPLERRANIKFEFPKLPDYTTEVEPLSADLRGTVDLERVVVIAGFAEVGPYGNSRTRWDMEAYGHFSLEGCIEMAWIMGLIKHHNGLIKGESYSGWVDTKNEEPIADKDIKRKYEQYILNHSGIRALEPRSLDGHNPTAKQFLHEVDIQHDLQPFEASKEAAQEFKREHGDKVDVFEVPESNQFQVILKKGARLMIPKALPFDHAVGGQVPTGWDARTYGISEDIINQVDPATLYPLICTIETLLSAGITDPYEIYQYIHVSELGNCVGSGLGGVVSLQSMFKERFLDQSVQKDVLAESFINSGSAWINMLLLSCSGPNVTPVGACATAVESMDIGYQLIVSGKAKSVLVGGFDGLSKDVSYEFANMKATNNVQDDFARGRSVREMSRPTTSTRKGFVESEGCGTQLLTTAQLAIEMGLPIHGVVALTHTASDKVGRSLPAPGKGLLTTVAKKNSEFDSPLMNVRYRKHNLELRRHQIKEIQESEVLFLQEELASFKNTDVSFDVSDYRQQRLQEIAMEAVRQEREALNTYGNHFWKQDARISPLQGALATWGLTVDDLDVASFHGTSTVLNDKNESEVINSQLAQLGRKEGNTILGVFQKYLTGHSKGAAGAWMMNGCLQVLNTGLVPGNRNADNIDENLKKFDYIAFPNRSIQTDGVKAFTVTSFGFGQKGAQAIGVHPKYLFASLDKKTYRAYEIRVQARQKKAYRYFHDSLLTNKMFVAKEKAPYSDEQELAFLLDQNSRLPMDNQLA
ncbi:MAG: 3-oxoacyl-[acyl-carrier-protein] synthase [Sclerophora amabilis]|nr:MAG: 3-oxoacyl-[acyl-carrier-protein] synthase [Sclerophora amabilis]